MTRRTPPTRAAVSVLVALAGALAPTLAPAQSAQEVLREAYERHQSRMEGIDDYTVVKTVGGVELTSHFTKEEVDGRTVFVGRVVGTGMGQAPGMGGGAESTVDNPYRLFTQLGDRATLEGSETVDGEECHVLFVSDLEGTDLETLGPASSNFQATSIRLFVDADQYVPRKSVIEGTMRARGESAEVTTTVRFRDYREVEGMLHPFRTETTAEGYGSLVPEEQRAKMEQRVEMMRQRMEQMPEGQRKKMKKSLEQMEAMLGQGAATDTIRVQEIRVNEGAR